MVDMWWVQFAAVNNQKDMEGVALDTQLFIVKALDSMMKKMLISWSIIDNTIYACRGWNG